MSSKVKRYKKGDQKKEKIAQVLEKTGLEGKQEALELRASKKTKQKFIKPRFLKRSA